VDGCDPKFLTRCGDGGVFGKIGPGDTLSGFRVTALSVVSRKASGRSMR